MAGRIALLVFATGMFISVWNAANKTPHSVIAARQSHFHTTPMQPVVLSSGTNSLPPDICPGTYRVVDDQGAVDIISVTRGQLSGIQCGSGPARRLYESKAGSRSLFFIRIRMHEEAARLPRTNPKFDFTGYLDAGESVR